MQQFTIEKGDTSRILQVSLFDSSSTTGEGLTGLVFNSAGLSAYYNREGAAGAATQITLVTATKGTYVSGGFVAVDGTNMPGVYELHVPDAAFASGAESVAISIKGATNLVEKNILVELVQPIDLGTDNRVLVSANAHTSGQTVADITASVSVDTLSANTITAASIAASALDGKGDWNIGKTGYTLTQSFPANFADMSITATTGLVDITQSAADKIWSSTTRDLTAFNFSVDIASINGVTVIGAGTSGDKWRA